MPADDSSEIGTLVNSIHETKRELKKVVDLVPIIVVVLLQAGGGKGPDLVGQIGGAVHEAVSVVCKRVTLFIGDSQPAADIVVDENENQQQHQRKNGRYV